MAQPFKADGFGRTELTAQNLGREIETGISGLRAWEKSVGKHPTNRVVALTTVRVAPGLDKFDVTHYAEHHEEPGSLPIFPIDHESFMPECGDIKTVRNRASFKDMIAASIKDL